FPEDRVHATYEPEWVDRFRRVLISADAVLKEHRARFRGKTSPVHFFWGSFDLSYTRFSGRLLDPPAAAGTIMRATHDAEQACAGFWPGGALLAFLETAYRAGAERADWPPELAAG
ncbi:MAG TPA: DUF5996 family protein, partial [Gaiellaceae bacterium]|nr:DUF5996 family protein [Gaiellaceae bacterium]